MKYVIMALGTNGTGKSTLITSIAQSYGVQIRKRKPIHCSDVCCLVGKYTLNATRTYTGGIDVFANRDEVLSYISQVWNTDIDVVAFEGVVFVTFVLIKELMNLECKRRIIMFYLNNDDEELQRRFNQRTHFSPQLKGMKHVVNKRKEHKRLFEKILEEYAERVVYHRELEMRSVKDIYDVMREVERITGIKMKEYVCELDRGLKQAKLF